MNLALKDVPSDQVLPLTNNNDIFTICSQNLQGSSKCMAAIQWNSIDLTASPPVYNYTLRGNSGLTYINTDSRSTDTDNYLLPVQWAVESAITNQTTVPKTLPFTSQSRAWYKRQTTARFMKIIRDWIAPAFYLAMIGVVYHMAGTVAQERQSGITDLLNSMGNHQLSRIVSNHIAFSSVYAPGWIALGFIFSYVVFISSSPATIIFFHIFAGLAQVSWSIFLGNIFNNAQLSGITSSGLSTVLAILTSVQAQLKSSGGHASGTIYVLSFLFPPMNYCFFLQNLARAELDDKALNMVEFPAASSVYSIVIFFAAIFQIFLFILLSVAIERVVYGRTQKLPTGAPMGTAVQISGLTKVYKTGGLVKQLRKNQNIVTAVDDLNLEIGKGQIFSLLGANGSGKTTTLEMIAGIQKSSAGQITFGPGSKVGICPQKNVLWDNLTVREHIMIWAQIKGVPPSEVGNVAAYLIKHCGLQLKAGELTKNLSGGQKRKVQLAIMFAGGSNICCIDEASSGLDPVSRRVIWDILLAFRGTHTLILTTHFLDEADILSDNIAILSKGQLRAQGTTVHLKETLGEGYRVFVSHPGTGKEDVHTMPDAGSVSAFIAQLEASGKEYRVAGPQLEDVFLGLASKDHDNFSNDFKLEEDLTEQNEEEDSGVDSVEYKPVGFFIQLISMLKKRYIVFRRSPLPEVVFFVLPIFVAAVTSSFLSSFPGSYCQGGGRYQVQKYTSYSSSTAYNIPIAQRQTFLDRSDGLNTFLLGLTSHNNEAFNNNQTYALQKSYDTFMNDSTILDSSQSWLSYIHANYSFIYPGGVDIDDLTIAYQANTKGGMYNAPFMLNLLTNLRANGTVSVVSNFSPFQVQWVLNTGKILQFAMYFGLSMACVPAFTALYPTYERLSNVRAMQYSNGLRVTPLWTAYTFFHLWLVVLVALITTVIIATSLHHINGAGYLFVVLMLYGLASTLLSYVISLFVKSQLAAFAVAASYQAAYLLIYLIGYLCTQAYGSPNTIETDILVIHYTLSLISPISNLCRSLFVAVNLFGILCVGEGQINYMGDIRAYGGPILYLTLQCVILFSFLLWWESGNYRLKGSWLSRFFKRRKADASERVDFEATEKNVPRDVLDEVQRVESNLEQFKDGLALVHVHKKFDTNHVVNDATFGVGKGECFALLGPNGAGKTTTFNMIRGELSMSAGEIYVTGIPVSSARTEARARLGVCPQFDAMDKMTVEEILTFYARLRGIAKNKIKHHVDFIIHAVGVDRFRTRMANKLSGGNKRKLSLGVALIGNPRVLLLDEPSSGMDAFAKRIMWNTLAEVARGRSIVLTTHSMEEADALANRAGILARRMLTCGTTDELRTKHGQNYHVHIVLKSAPASTAAEMDRVVGWMQTMLRGAVVEDRMYQGQIKMAVPISTVHSSSSSSNSKESSKSGATITEKSSTTHKLSEIFDLLEHSKSEMGIDSYSVSHTSLEEVFLKIVGQYDQSAENEESI